MAIVNNGIVGTVTMTETSVVTDGHPIVSEAIELKADNGVLDAGLILALNDSGTAEGYDPTVTAGSTLLVPVGVLMFRTDTSRDNEGIVLKHGFAVGKALTVAGGDAADTDDFAALKAALPVWIA
jgi:hypothetical protein